MKSKVAHTPIPPLSDGEAAENLTRRQRIIDHALWELGPLSAHEQAQIARAQGHYHSTPMASSLESEFVRCFVFMLIF